MVGLVAPYWPALKTVSLSPHLKRILWNVKESPDWATTSRGAEVGGHGVSGWVVRL